MSTPTGPEKRLFAAGFKKGSTWGTAVALGAGNGLLITNDGGLSRKQGYFPVKEHDQGFVSDGTLGPIEAVDFAPEFGMRYDPGLLGTLIAMLFGTAGVPTLVGPTLAYKHVLTWADTIWGLFGTFAIERPNKIWEVASCKPTKLDLSLAEGLLKGKISLRGNTLIDNSSVNQAAQMDALTYVDRLHLVRFLQGSVKMNDQSDVDVAGTTALVVNEMSISVERPSDALVPLGATGIVQPANPDFPKLQIKLKFPRFGSTNEGYFQKFTGQTTQKILVQFTGDLIETTYYYDFKLLLPRLRVVDFDAPDDEIIPVSLTLEAEQAATNPTGMNSTKPYIELVNKQATDYLA